MKPYPVAPHWVALWIPVRTQGSGAGLVRAVYRLESNDTLKWVNTLESAHEREKERMWADPMPIRRLSSPGVLSGHAEKPSSEALQKAYGSAASATLLAILQGAPPPQSAPTLGLLAGLLGLMVLGFFFRSVGRSPLLAEATAEQQITQVNVSDVKLEIGALEELRDEERRQQRKPKID